MLRIVGQLKRHRFAAPFGFPVDESIAPGYFDVISDPMDLSTLEANAQRGQYRGMASFTADLKRIWTNAYRYNPRNSEIVKMARELEAFGDKLLSGDPAPASDNKEIV